MALVNPENPRYRFVQPEVRIDDEPYEPGVPLAILEQRSHFYLLRIVICHQYLIDHIDLLLVHITV